MKTASIILSLVLLTSLVSAKEYFIATDGNDLNNGSADKPMASPDKAARLLKAGDTLWVRGGTYMCLEGIRLSAAGKKDSPIRIFAVAGQRPVFDLAKARGDGIVIDGAWWHLKGLTVTHAERSGIRLNGMGAFRITLENCTAWANENTGIHMGSGAADNTILNCDSYENFDARKHGQDADGFAAKFDIGTGNRFIGCRSWNNSDDGYDCWYAGNGAHFENCYAWANGVNIWKDPLFEGNGNGFKLGQLGGAHVLIRCVAWDQAVRGFDLNGNSTGVRLENCTAYRNKTNFDFRSSRGNIEKNVLRNCLSFEGPVLIPKEVDDKNNSWNTPGLTVTKDDFQSLDVKCMEGARNADGSLPKCESLHLTPASKAKGFGAFN